MLPLEYQRATLESRLNWRYLVARSASRVEISWRNFDRISILEVHCVMSPLSAQTGFLLCFEVEFPRI